MGIKLKSITIIIRGFYDIDVTVVSDIGLIQMLRMIYAICAADDSVSFAIHPKWFEVFYKERWTNFTRGGGNM